MSNNANTNMTKRNAESILGLKGAYVYKDVLKAYRSKVKTCHPDAGGKTEDMVELNNAKDYMDSLFANDKNAVYSTVPDSANTTSAYGNDSETPESAADDNWREHVNDPDFEQAMNEAFNQHTRAERGERVRAAYREKHGGGIAKNADDAKNQAPAETEATENASTPLWYKVFDWIVNHFPWRIVLLIVPMWCLFGYLTDTSIPMTGAATMCYVLFAALGLLNLATGIITTPIRKLLRLGIDAALRAARR